MSYIAPSKVLAHAGRLDQWKQGLKPSPVTVEWDLSNRCYLGCQSCHFAHTHSKGPWVAKDRLLPMAWEGTGDLADTPLVLNTLREMSYCGVKGIIWSGGGEPTLHPDYLKIAAVAYGLGIKQGMYTAGGLLQPHTAATLAHYLSWVVISLDAVDEETYAMEKGVHGELFHRACNGARSLAEMGKTTVGISFLLHEKNWHRMADMLSLGRELGGNYVTFRPTIDTMANDPARITSDRAWITQALPVLEEMSRERDVECDPARFAAYRDWNGRKYNVCHGIKLNATITPDGRVWVCPQRRGLPDSCVGDLRKEGFSALWQRHPGQWTDFSGCRAMCRLHLDNEVLAHVFEPYRHEEFV